MKTEILMFYRNMQRNLFIKDYILCMLCYTFMCMYFMQRTDCVKLRPLSLRALSTEIIPQKIGCSKLTNRSPQFKKCITRVHAVLLESNKEAYLLTQTPWTLNDTGFTQRLLVQISKKIWRLDCFFCSFFLLCHRNTSLGGSISPCFGKWWHSRQSNKWLGRQSRRDMTPWWTANLLGAQQGIADWLNANLHLEWITVTIILSVSIFVFDCVLDFVCEHLVLLWVRVIMLTSHVSG